MKSCSVTRGAATNSRGWRVTLRATHAPGTPGEAAKDADAILLAVHWSRIDAVLKQAGDMSGKVIVTCCLPMDAGKHETHHGHHYVGSRRTRKESSTRSCSSDFQHRSQ